jgi:hypothetical protein
MAPANKPREGLVSNSCAGREMESTTTATASNIFGVIGYGLQSKRFPLIKYFKLQRLNPAILLYKSL